jgi:hypothetical protein
MKISEATTVSTDIKSITAIIFGVAVGVWSYFGLQEKINKHDTRLELMEKDLEENTEFRIKWPRGEMGSLPADSEQFMLIEDLYKSTEKLIKNQEMNTSNKLRIEFMEKQINKMQINKMLNDIEKLKDANREIKFGNGNGGHK